MNKDLKAQLMDAATRIICLLDNGVNVIMRYLG